MAPSDGDDDNDDDGDAHDDRRRTVGCGREVAKYCGRGDVVQAEAHRAPRGNEAAPKPPARCGAIRECQFVTT